MFPDQTEAMLDRTAPGPGPGHVLTLSDWIHRTHTHTHTHNTCNLTASKTGGRLTRGLPYMRKYTVV